jgi:hypothetical protein
MFQLPLIAFIISDRYLVILMNKDILDDYVHLLFAHLMHEWHIDFVCTFIIILLSACRHDTLWSQCKYMLPTIVIIYSTNKYFLKSALYLCLGKNIFNRISIIVGS